MMSRFFFLFLVSLIIGCSSSIPKREYDNFFKLNFYKPEDISQIIGKYERSSGLSGEIMVLMPDSTFYYNSWTDILIPDNPIKGFSGRYYISGDTLVFIFKKTVFKDSTYNEKKLNRNQRINNRIQLIRLSSVYTPSFLVKYKDNIYIMTYWMKKTFKETYSNIEDFLKYNEYNNSKIGRTVLIKSNSK